MLMGLFGICVKINLAFSYLIFWPINLYARLLQMHFKVQRTIIFILALKCVKIISGGILDFCWGILGGNWYILW